MLAGAADAEADPYLAEAARKLSTVGRCAPSGDGEDDIVVCGRRDSGERFRLPIRDDKGFDPDAGVDSVMRERRRLIDVGDSGIGSCSTSGAGGAVGCFFQDVRRYREQHGQGWLRKP